MKRLLTLILALMMIAGNCQQASAQTNLQIHSDFGRLIYEDEEAGRPRMTATLESLHLDLYGWWYYYADFDFYEKGMAGAYVELTRDFNLTPNRFFSLHLEYNGGLHASRKGGMDHIDQNAALIGPAINFGSDQNDNFFAAQFSYKQYFKGYNRKGFGTWQLSGIWNFDTPDKKWAFKGFIDLWHDHKKQNNLVFVTEPSLWYHYNTSLGFGTEWELSNNYIQNKKRKSDKTFFANPTLAVRWRF